MDKAHVLVVDDEADILELVRVNLERHGYEVTTAESGEEAVSVAQQEKPDLLVLDLMLPGMDGLEVCKKLKADSDTAGMPILMLTARGEEPDIVTGLELGADDYVTKPFSPRVLMARVKAVLRRSRAAASAPTGKSIKRDELVINLERREVTIARKQLDLTFSEFGMLAFLAARPGWVFTRNQIIDAVHGTDYPVTDRSVDVQIVSLRKKMGEAGLYIETVRGVGYRFKDE